MEGHIIGVDEIKVYKPSPRVYKMAPAKFNVDPAAIGFVSSNSWDIDRGRARRATGRRRGA